MALRTSIASFRNFDWPLLAVICLLVAFGLAAIFSVTLNQEQQDLSRFWRQVGFVVAGLAFLFLLARSDYRILPGSARYVYVLAIALLVLVLLFGDTIRGAKAWFSIGTFGIQPVEFVKLFLIIALARVFSAGLPAVASWRTIGITFVMTALPVALVIAQPDLGSATVLIAVWVGILLFARVPFRRLIAIFLLLIIGTIVFGGFVLSEEQRSRITVFLSPEKNCLKEAWNVCQSVTAVGSGQIFGRGLGLGSQSQLNFLPEQETDFIFAAIAEEMGFVGATVLLTLFCVFFWRLMHVLRTTQDGFAMLVVAGIFIMFFAQMFVNVGMNMGIMPITGIPLPFVSYGGSSLIASLLAIGLVEAIARQARSRQAISD